MSFRLRNSERQTGQKLAKKNMNVGRSLSTRLARVTVEPSTRVSSKSGARSPTLFPIWAVTTGAVVAVGSGVEVGGTAVAVGGTGVDVGGTAVAVGGGGGVGVSGGETGIAVGGTDVAKGAAVGTTLGAGAAVDVGAIGGVEGAPVYTPDGVREG